MRRAVFVRALLTLVALAPVIRATCDVRCIEAPASPPACHESAPDQEHGCSHDHDGLVARLSDATPYLAVLPAVFTVAAPIASTQVDVGAAGALASRGSPPVVLRV